LSKFDRAKLTADQRLSADMMDNSLLYVFAAVAGWMRCRKAEWLGLLILFVVLRSLFLGSLENPEPRYTLEMYPIVIVLAAAALAGNRGLAQR
jgi:hypothetical protein